MTFPLPASCFGSDPEGKCQTPCITTGKGVGAAVCGCGWESPYVWGSAAGASIAWAEHVADRVVRGDSYVAAPPKSRTKTMTVR